MIISFTGHRSVGGYSYPNPTYNYVCQETEKLLLELKPEKCLSGMAVGFDQIAAFICIKLNIEFDAIIPHIGQENIWQQSQKDTYNKLLNKASNKIIVSEGGYAAWKMHTRNEYLVDNSNVIVAYFNGTKGGTQSCLDYAKKQNKQIYIISCEK